MDLAENITARKRAYATRLTALKLAIAGDPMMREGLAATTRQRLLEELNNCATALVIRGNPWRKP